MAKVTTPYIAWAHLGEILLASLVSGLALVALVSLGIMALSVSHRDSVTPSARRTAISAALLCSVASLAVVGWAFYLVVHKG